MVDAANKEGIEFVADTTYRSFDDQETIYNNYKSKILLFLDD